MTRLIDSHAHIGENVNGLYIMREQEITDDFLDEIKDDRHASSTMRAGEYHKVASVPTQVADIWMAQGFNIYHEPARAVVERLRKENLDAFIASNKRI